MDTLLAQQQLLYQDHSRPGSSSSSSSALDHLAYPPSSQSSLAFQQHYQSQHHQPRKESPGSSSLQITTANSNPQDQDVDEQTAHPSRMQPQFPPPQQDPTSIKSSMMTGFSRALTHREQELLSHLDRLKFFLATAPSRWNSGDPDDTDPSTLPVGHPSSTHPALNRFLLPNSEYVSCVLWAGLYHITGTDIVRALVFRFEAFGRPVRNMKKFEEGVFSDLRNLKPGTDACLEEPKSPFLDLLFKYQCIRTQKKQKVFYWFSVPHDRLFLDALERDLKREKMGMEPTTVIAGEPALSFTYDPKRSLYEQFCKAQGGYEGEGELEAAVRRVEEITGDGEDEKSDAASSAEEAVKKPTILNNPNTPFANMFSLFEGSPTYKQRRKKTTKKGSTDSTGRSTSVDDVSDHYSRDTTRMNAADMFMAQARGELASAGMIESTHPRTPMHPEHNHLQAQPVRGRLEQRNTYPANPQPYSVHPNAQRQAYHAHSATLPGDWPYMEGTQSSEPTPMSSPPSTARTKAFVCPLFSCSRMFKRMEHLKRHLRTHTMERPFQCQRCNKKFSRSDNLNQHIRIHLRIDAEGTGGSAGYLNGMVDESIFDDGVNADVEDVDELDGEDASFLADVTDVRLCEVEVQGNVREVQGDEEGLVTTEPLGYVPNGDSGVGPAAAHHTTYYGNNGAGPFPLSSSPEPASYNSDTSPAVQWMMPRSAPSPAFSSASMPSPQSRMSSVAPSAPYSSMGDYMTSLSAPSHKATFDHAAIYAHHHAVSPGPGPVRRHRSVTPSLVRYGESIRRPYSAAMSDVPAAASRSYHPYAVPASSSHSGSAQSSPGSYNVPLDYGSTMSGHVPIPVSRSESVHGSRPGSSHLQDQMNQMLTLDSVDGEHHMGYGSEPGSHGYSGLYRTDSPASYAHTNGTYSGSPATRATMLDANAMYTMHGQSHYGGHDGQFYNHGHAQSVPM